MKKFVKALSAILAVMLFSVTLFACNGGGGGTSSPAESVDDGALVDGKAVVKFDLNLEGTGFTEADVTSVKEQKIEPGNTAVNRPLTVKSTAFNGRNLGFRGWCTDKAGTTYWNFEEPVTRSMTLYAKWEARCIVTYTIPNKASSIVRNVFPGEKAEPLDSEAGWKRVLGWYTDPSYAESALYDFDSEVTGNLDLYAKVADGIYINPAKMTSFLVHYGNIAGKDPDDDTTITVEEKDGEVYARVHFAKCENTSYIYYNNFNEYILNNLVEMKRNGDVMTITYKNLGPSNYFRFYYVVAYFDENNELNGIYSDGTYEHGSIGMWSKNVDIPIKSNMSETDEWETVSVNLVEATMISKNFGTTEDPDWRTISEWGESVILCIPRWEALTVDGSGRNGDYSNNDVLFKGITFTAAEA